MGLRRQLRDKARTWAPVLEFGAALCLVPPLALWATSGMLGMCTLVYAAVFGFVATVAPWLLMYLMAHDMLGRTRHA